MAVAYAVSVLAAIGARVDTNNIRKTWAWIASVSAWITALLVFSAVVEELVSVVA